MPLASCLCWYLTTVSWGCQGKSFFFHVSCQHCSWLGQAVTCWKIFHVHILRYLNHFNYSHLRFSRSSYTVAGKASGCSAAVLALKADLIAGICGICWGAPNVEMLFMYALNLGYLEAERIWTWPVKPTYQNPRVKLLCLPFPGLFSYSDDVHWLDHKNPRDRTIKRVWN